MRATFQRTGVLLVSVAIGCALMLVAGATAGTAADQIVTAPAECTPPAVMCNLDNPRGLAFGPQGALYVAEAGLGGFGTENPFCFINCFGQTGAVSRLWQGVQQRVVAGLPSHANSDGSRAIGPSDIAMLGPGRAYVTIGFEQDVTLRDALAEQVPAVAGFASLTQVEPSGEWRSVADIGAFEGANNPDGRLNPDGTPVLDTDPYGVAAIPGGELVTDAGGNSLLRVDANGQISLLAVFQSRGSAPPRPSGAPSQFDQFTDAVPTSIAVGPDGAYYVGELTGVPFVDKKANIYRVAPDAAPRLFLTSDACLSGFKMIIDFAFDAQGNLYVLQYATGALQQPGGGILVRVTPNRSAPGGICDQYETGTRTTILGGTGQVPLRQPTSVAIGPDGALYVSNRGISAGNGEVLRVEP